MIRTILLIGVVIFTTFAALFVGGSVTSYLYNIIWLTSGNDTPKCLMSVPVENCELTDAQYLDGLILWSNITSFSIIVAGAVIGIMLYRRKMIVSAN
jgi:hypothetical protein